MAVRDRAFLDELIKTHIGEKTDDETLKLLEDYSDTLDDYEKRISGDGTDWKAKYEENDKAWREKYQARFFNKEVISEGERLEQQLSEPPAKREFGDLFTDPSSNK